MVVPTATCGVLGLDDAELRTRLAVQFGPAEKPASFHGFMDIENNIREQMRKVKSHPWLRGRVVVRGFIYEVKTGALREVSAD